MSKPKNAVDPTLEKPKALADYFEVVYLKRTDQAGMWAAHAVPFPTEAEAETHADALREGQQGSIKVMPRMWA